jgi:hypothetical protein
LGAMGKDVEEIPYREKYLLAVFEREKDQNNNKKTNTKPV